MSQDFQHGLESVIMASGGSDTNIHICIYVYICTCMVVATNRDHGSNDTVAKLGIWDHYTGAIVWAQMKIRNFIFRYMSGI